MTRRYYLRRRLLLRRAVAVTLLAYSCSSGSRDVGVSGEPGDPLPRLRPHELTQFFAGRSLFEKVYKPEEGLGPLFNENQCSACHTLPASGGTTGFERVVKATRFEPPNTCITLHEEGGENIRTRATPRLKARGVERQAIPEKATEIGRFLPPFLFGLGLVEAIPEEVLLRSEDPDDRDADGISGRAGRTPSGRIARFGRKAEFPTIENFVESALHLEMGLTTPHRAAEDSLLGLPYLSDLDSARDPDVDEVTVSALSAFVRFLVPPAPMVARSRSHRDSLAAGKRLFISLGCDACHTPALQTGANAVPALNRQTVALYSDLLLHDIGPALANVCSHAATPTEVRTEPLMGLRHRDRLLHDGRTSDLAEAILLHGGEARKARDAFVRLSPAHREYLLKFLRSL